jgi:rhodanese-related sulfurtransferase
MVGCRVQQTCTACAEQAAEVVRNGKGGTSAGSGIPGPMARREAPTELQGDL